MAGEIRFIEYIRSIIGFILFVVLMTLVIPIIMVLLILTFGKSTNFIIRTFGPAIAHTVFAVFGIRFKKKYHGPKFDKPAIYLINHSSTLDILALMATGLDRIRFVVKWELQYFPFFFFIGRLTGQIFIKRQHSEKAIQTLVKAYDRIKKNGLSIMVAPEGSRKHEGIIGPFKKGAFRMAIDLGYPIVPLYYEGNKELSYAGSMLTKSGTITAHIHPPIDTSEWSLETIEDHIAETRALYLKWAGIQA